MNNNNNRVVACGSVYLDTGERWDRVENDLMIIKKEYPSPVACCFTVVHDKKTRKLAKEYVQRATNKIRELYPTLELVSVRKMEVRLGQMVVTLAPHLTWLELSGISVTALAWGYSSK